MRFDGTRGPLAEFVVPSGARTDRHQGITTEIQEPDPNYRKRGPVRFQASPQNPNRQPRSHIDPVKIGEFDGERSRVPIIRNNPLIVRKIARGHPIDNHDFRLEFG